MDKTTILLALIRAVHFSACLLPLSVFTTILLVVNPASGRIGKAPVPPGASNALAHFQKQTRHLLAACIITAFISGFLWLWFSIAGMSGATLRESLDATMFKMVLTETPPGHIWLLRAAILLLLTAACIFRHSSLVIRHLLCLCLAGLLTGSLAWLGHAGATDGPLAKFHLLADILHLLSAAVWPGALVPFALFIRLLLKSRDPTLLTIASAATHRFSSMSLAAVAVLAASGSANSCFMLGSLHALFTIGYGRLLLFKFCIFLAMITLGAINLLNLKPRLSNIPGTASPTGATEAAQQKIARNVLIELCLGALVLLVVGILGITPPAMH
ncbi:MAG: CopD family protein [Chthoniobacteraceae bacterium]